MQKIVVLGAGKSAYVLFKYLIDLAKHKALSIVIADQNIRSIDDDIAQSSAVTVCSFSIDNHELFEQLIQESDLVISMLPARFHDKVAEMCLRYQKHLITPSYVSEKMKAMSEEAREKNLIFLNEMGLDPGIDHMSAMRIIDELKEKKHSITGFESFTGGLIAPESDNNPWHYKFTWNPRNVVLAGQGPAVKFLHNGKYKYIPYHKLFDRTEIVEIDEYGKFEGYANRDSLKYIDIYGLHGIQTMYRGTFRRPPFCKAWHILVQIGATDDSFVIDDSENMTYRAFINSFLKYRKGDSVELKLAYYVHVDVDSEEMELLKWAGLFSDEKIGLKKATPAQVLQHKLESKWAMHPEDKDMIVMWHLFNYREGEEEKRLESFLVVTGDNPQETAMAKTVGLPIGIAAKRILSGQIKERGVLIPTLSSIYKPVLEELNDYGITFQEKYVQ